MFALTKVAYYSCINKERKHWYNDTVSNNIVKIDLLGCYIALIKCSQEKN